MRSRRLLFVLLVGALVIGALAAGRASTATAGSSTTDTTAPAGVSVVAQSSTVWFCPGLPPSLPHASARLTFANIGGGAADAVVTDLTDSGNTTHKTIAVPGNSVVAKNRDEIGAPGALTVETFGGRVVVEEGMQGAAGFEATPCATQSSPDWYFAAGSTLRGVQQWLVIDNPYASDARIDVTLRTSSGMLHPSLLQGLDVARRSREVVPIHDLAVRQDRVAVSLHAEVGSVVAAQALVYTTAAGLPGVAFSIGSPAPATDWKFAGGIAEPGSVAVVAIANVGNDDAQVDVQATAESSKQTLAPASLTVAQDAVTWVSLGQCAVAAGKACVSIPEGVRYSLDVRSERNISIVAQTLMRFDAGAGVVGTVTTPGATAPARSWAFGRSRVAGEVTTTLSFFNPSASPATVDVGLARGGTVGRPSALQNIKVPAGRQVTMLVASRKPVTPDAALTITADQPIYVSRIIATSTESSSAVGAVVR